MLFSRLLPILIIIGAIGLIAGYVHPTYTGSVAELRKEIHDYDTALAAAKQFKQKEAELARQKANIAPEELERLEAFLPDSVDNVQLIVDLDALADRTGVDLSEYAVGTYDAFRTFLDGIETSLRPLDVVELSVQDSATGVYTYAMTLQLYWLR